MVGLKEAKTSLNAVRNTTGSVATANEGDLMNHYRMLVLKPYLLNPAKNLILQY